MWGRGEQEGTVSARDVRRSQTLTIEHIDEALKLVAELTIMAKACILRTADLILNGELKGGESHDGSPAVRWRGQLVWL
jgi:hypothetical protein